jgi:HEAT repeat protein
MYRKKRQLLTHPDPQVRRQAIEELIAYPADSELIYKIVPMLNDGDRGIRDAVASWCKAHPTLEVAQVLSKYIGSECIVVRNLAGDTLVKMGDVSVAAICPFVDHPDRDIRKFAIDLLCLLPSHACLEKIAAHLDDPDENVIISAIEAIGALGGQQYLTNLMECYRKYPFARNYILFTISQFPQHEKSAFWYDAISGDDPVMKNVALEAIVQDPSLESLSIVLTCFEQADDANKRLILKPLVEILEANPTLGKQLPLSVKHALLATLKDPDDEFVEIALRGLKFLTGAQIVHSLIPIMGRSENIDLLIYQILYAIPVNVIGQVLNAAENHVISIPTAARFALALVAKHLQSDEWLRRDPTIHSFGQFLIDNFHYLDAESKLTAIDLFGRYRLKGFIALLTEAMLDNETIVRYSALGIIEQLRDTRFLNVIENATEDADLSIRQMAWSMLKQFKQAGKPIK